MLKVTLNQLTANHNVAHAQAVMTAADAHAGVATVEAAVAAAAMVAPQLLLPVLPDQLLMLLLKLQEMLTIS